MKINLLDVWEGASKAAGIPARRWLPSTK